jgi:ribosomal protein L5
MYSKNYQEKSKLFRCFNYKNIHKAPFPVSKITLFYTVKKDISLKSLIRISAFLELITGQRAFFLRSKKSSIFLKIRKGAPLGVKVNLRNKKLFHFLFRVIWEILPSLKNFKLTPNLTKVKQENLNSSMLFISDPLIFYELKNFYFFFKSCTDLRINISFPSSCKKKELFFINRLLKLPS